MSGGHPDWFPYDISCNLIRNADTTQIHYDCSDEEDEWTFLLYLNPAWDVNNYGETVFYDSSDDNTEIITEVLPKYGRVVIFQGVVPNSGKPASALLPFLCRSFYSPFLLFHSSIPFLPNNCYLSFVMYRNNSSFSSTPKQKLHRCTTVICRQVIKKRMDRKAQSISRRNETFSCCLFDITVHEATIFEWN